MAAVLCAALLGPALAAQDPYSAPEVRVSDLGKPAARATAKTRVKVVGVVTRQRLGTSLHIRTENGSVRAETDVAVPVVPGDRVEAVGTPSPGAYSPFLANAVFRRIGTGSAPPPMAASLRDLMGGHHDSDLVSVEGTFVSGETVRDEYNFLLQDEGMVFNALLIVPGAGAVPTRLRAGERVRLTGICSVEASTEPGSPSFRLLLRDAADIVEVVAAPPPIAVPSDRTPWWTWLMLALAVAAAGGFAWAFRTTQSQEQTIRRQLAREASLKARFDDLFERSSEIFVVHDRRGRVSTLNRAGEQERLWIFWIQ